MAQPTPSLASTVFGQPDEISRVNTKRLALASVVGVVAGIALILLGTVLAHHIRLTAGSNQALALTGAGIVVGIISLACSGVAYARNYISNSQQSQPQNLENVGAQTARKSFSTQQSPMDYKNNYEILDDVLVNSFETLTNWPPSLLPLHEHAPLPHRNIHPGPRMDREDYAKFLFQLSGFKEVLREIREQHIQNLDVENFLSHFYSPADIARLRLTKPDLDLDSETSTPPPRADKNRTTLIAPEPEPKHNNSRLASAPSTPPASPSDAAAEPAGPSRTIPLSHPDCVKNYSSLFTGLGYLQRYALKMPPLKKDSRGNTFALEEEHYNFLKTLQTNPHILTLLKRDPSNYMEYFVFTSGKSVPKLDLKPLPPPPPPPAGSPFAPPVPRPPGALPNGFPNNGKAPMPVVTPTPPPTPPNGQTESPTKVDLSSRVSPIPSPDSIPKPATISFVPGEVVRNLKKLCAVLEAHPKLPQFPESNQASFLQKLAGDRNNLKAIKEFIPNLDLDEKGFLKQVTLEQNHVEGLEANRKLVLSTAQGLGEPFQDTGLRVPRKGETDRGVINTFFSELSQNSFALSMVADAIPQLSQDPEGFLNQVLTQADKPGSDAGRAPLGPQGAPPSGAEGVLSVEDLISDDKPKIALTTDLEENKRIILGILQALPTVAKYDTGTEIEMFEIPRPPNDILTLEFLARLIESRQTNQVISSRLSNVGYFLDKLFTSEELTRHYINDGLALAQVAALEAVREGRPNNLAIAQAQLNKPIREYLFNLMHTPNYINLLKTRAPNNPFSTISALITGGIEAKTLLGRGIADRLFIGSEVCAADLEFLKANNIKYVVNMPGTAKTFKQGDFTDISENFFEDQDAGIEYCPLEGLQDRGGNVIPFEEYAKWIDKCLAKGDGNVLIHCRQGKSRSGSMMIYMLMNRNGMNYQKAYTEFLQASGFRGDPVELPDPGFLAQLKSMDPRIDSRLERVPKDYLPLFEGNSHDAYAFLRDKGNLIKNSSGVAVWKPPTREWRPEDRLEPAQLEALTRAVNEFRRSKR